MLADAEHRGFLSSGSILPLADILSWCRDLRLLSGPWRACDDVSSPSKACKMHKRFLHQKVALGRDGEQPRVLIE
jgi:hypothetical protein